MGKETEKSGTVKNGKFYVPAWVTRGVGLAVNSVLLMQITFYATENVGLSAGTVGMLILVSKLFDGITDLLAGFSSERTHTRWGKARPYELFLIPTWILTVLLYSTPNSMSMTGKAVYIFILYLLINAVCVTFLSSSEAVFLARSTSDDNRRAHALTAAGVCAMFFPAGVGIILPMMMATWGSQPGGWTKIALVLGLPSCLLGLIRFLYIKEERDVTMEKDNVSLKESLQCLFQNKYVFIQAGAGLLSMLAVNVASASQTYYFTYIVGDLAKMSAIGVMGLAAPLALLIFPLALRKIGGMNFVKIGAVLAFIGSAMKYFAGANMTLILTGSLLAGVGAPAITMIGAIFVIQCIDYGEWKTGIRVEGIINAVGGFATKVGSGLASGLVGMIMGMAGYVGGGAATQSASANTAIVWCFSLVPAIFCVAMFILCCFYDLEEKSGKIREELEERHAKNRG